MSDEQPYDVDNMHADGEPLANPPFGGIGPLAKLSHYLKQKCVCSWTWGSYYCDSQGPHRDYTPRAPALTPSADGPEQGSKSGEHSRPEPAAVPE